MRYENKVTGFVNTICRTVVSAAEFHKIEELIMMVLLYIADKGPKTVKLFINQAADVRLR